MHLNWSSFAHSLPYSLLSLSTVENGIPLFKLNPLYGFASLALPSIGSDKVKV